MEQRTKKNDHLVSTIDALEALYDKPYGPAIVKEIDRVNAHYRAFIEAAPFFALATSGPDGLDCSPRGDAPGFVRVQDEKTLLIPDRRGNNRIDSLRNIVQRPARGAVVSHPRRRRDDPGDRPRQYFDRSDAHRNLHRQRQDAAHRDHRRGRAGVLPMHQGDHPLKAVGPRAARRSQQPAERGHDPWPKSAAAKSAAPSTTAASPSASKRRFIDHLHVRR